MEGVEFNKLADGSVEMKSNGAKATSSQWFDLPKEGLYEIEMELDHVTPGSRVVFGAAGVDAARRRRIHDRKPNARHGVPVTVAIGYDPSLRSAGCQ